jgi:MscS family membrane protein
LPLGARISKIMVLAIAAVAVLSLLGLPVASLIAGLGIGGLALALAAQKTVENLFGAFSIGVDQPFREGDFVKIEDFVGTVEAVGLRSSRFRTLDRTVITIPNGKLADMRLESFTARDRMRLATIIGLVYETTAAQMRDVLQGFEHVLRAHPKIWPDAVVVRFREFGASSLDIEIMAWFQTSEWSEFQLIRQEILLQFMDVVERAGSSIAFPTRTIHLGAEAIAAIANHRDESTAGSVVGDGGTSALRASSPHARGTTPNDSGHRG